MFTRGHPPSGPVESLLNTLPRGDPARKGEAEATAEIFTPTADIATYPALAYKSEESIFLGVVGATVSGEEADRKSSGGVRIGINDNRHMMTIAGTRSGKGRSAIIPNMLAYPGSVIATDPKGELATITARHRSKGLGQNVHVLDPFGVAKGYAIDLRKRFNPIMAMRPDKIVEDAALMADAIVLPTKGVDTHWDDSARTFIEGLILYVRLDPDYAETGSLASVRTLATRGELGMDGMRSMDWLQTAMVRNELSKSDDPAIRYGGQLIAAAGADLFDRPKNERGSVLSTVRRHLKFLDYPEIRDNVSGRGVSLYDLKDKATTIYLCLPARHIGTCNRWLRLFVNLTLQAMEVNERKPPKGLPVLFCLDEFAALGHMAQIEDAAGLIAGFGVKLWPVIQDLGQLEALYDKRWETFMGNAGVIQCFGNNDLTTLKWISERCGKTSIKTDDRNPVTSDRSWKGDPGISYKVETVELMTVPEIARLFSRYDPQMRQLVIWAGSRPLILQRVNYDTHEMFKGRFDTIPESDVR